MVTSTPEGSVPAGSTSTPPGERAPRPSAAGTFAGQFAPAVAVAVVVALALTALSGSATFTRLGLPDPGALTTYALPAVRAVAQCAAVATIGALLLAAFLAAPGERGWLGPDGYRGVRIAGWSSAIWVGAAILMVPLSVADAYGRPVGEILRAEVLISAVPALSAGQAWVTTAVVALVACALCRTALSWGATVVAFGAAVLGLMPVALTGHSASGGAHDVATNSLLFHVIAASLWVGGLLALVVHLLCCGADPGVAARRFSRLALACWVVMAISGIVNALVRVTPGQLFAGTYGLLLLVKIVALAALGGFGAWHRARSVPAAADGSGVALARVGGVELLLMFATIGVAVALGRTPPPPPTTGLPSRVEALIGYPLDGPLTPLGVITQSRFDLVFGTAAIVLAGLYVAGVRRLRARGQAWSAGRTAAWVLGCGVLLVATSSGIGRYAPAVFSVHMGQHVMLNLLAPILLVLGAPTTLALRALPAARSGAPPGPREWITALLGSPLARVLTHPLVTLALFVAGFYVLYLTGLDDAALSAHWAHLVMNAYFLLVGVLFFWSVLGIDPSPRRLPPLGRVGLLSAAVALHALFAVAVTSSDTVIGRTFYDQLGLPWIDRLSDQAVGGGLVWAGGELPVLVVLVALLLTWARRTDRHVDPELEQYDAALRGFAHPIDDDGGPPARAEAARSSDSGAESGPGL